MAQLARLFPALADRIAGFSLLMAAGLYAGSFLLPAGQLVPDANETRATGREAFVLAPLLYQEMAKDVLAADGALRTAALWVRSNLDLFSIMVAWLANPFAWAAALALLLGRWLTASVAGALGLLIGLSVCAWAFIGQWTFFSGYYVWLASMALLTGAGAYRALRPRARPVW